MATGPILKEYSIKLSFLTSDSIFLRSTLLFEKSAESSTSRNLFVEVIKIGDRIEAHTVANIRLGGGATTKII